MKKMFLFVLTVLFGFSVYSENIKSAEAQKVMDYLTSVYGNKIISGQMDLTWSDSTDMLKRIYKDTKTYPVIYGFDFMNYTNRQGNGLNQVEEALKWWDGDYKYDTSYKGYKGGLVAFCWHWRAGKENQFYTDKTTFRIPFENGKLNMEADSFKKIKKDLDEIAKHLGRLKNLGVPVLWRPLHEASGGWFWWGASGEDAYKALYKYMYTYFTEEKNLDNLIWIWNGQNEKWYPGDDYVDIVGEDIYSNDHSSQKLSFLLSKNITDGNKMVCLSECGRIPDPICCKQDNACWLYFMVWNDATTSGSVFTKEDFWSSSVVNSLEFRQKVYSSPFVITLDKVKPGDYK